MSALSLAAQKCPHCDHELRRHGHLGTRHDVATFVCWFCPCQVNGSVEPIVVVAAGTAPLEPPMPAWLKHEIAGSDFVPFVAAPLEPGPSHEFEPGIDIDDPENPSALWCNVCGEPHAAPLEPGGEIVSGHEIVAHPTHEETTVAFRTLASVMKHRSAYATPEQLASHILEGLADAGFEITPRTVGGER